MSAKGRPVSLAMEFFERDTQPSLDAYLDGRIEEGDFNTLTRRNRAYATSHRPMIEYCRAASIPVIAANAPWRLMRAMGKSGLSFAEYRLSVEPADRAWLPRESEMLKGAYLERFEAVMGSHGDGGSTASTQPADTQPATSAPAEESESAGEASAASENDTNEAPENSSEAETATTSPVEDASEDGGGGDEDNESAAASQPVEAKPSAAERMEKAYRAQSLWDDAMAEAVSDHRGRFTNRRVMLVVGVFHVEREGGLWTKLKRARPEDAMLTIVFRGAQPPFAFDEADLGAGDVVIYGIAPPEEEEPGR
ncbi:MAG: ChaN family lipoprotein [Planctomycetes bacterium]|nr:ChaN family lipoprotein [Planctomycetota bacterium]